MVQSMLNNKPKISFVFVPGLEFITALYRIANLELFEDTYADHHVSQDAEVITQLTAMRDRLTPFMQRELDFFFKLEHSHADEAFHQLMFTSTLPQTVTELIRAIEDTEPWEFVEYLIEDRTDEVSRESFLKLWEVTGHPAEPDVTEWMRATDGTSAGARVLEAVSYPQETKARFLSLLRSFYERAYAPHENDIAVQCTRAIRRVNELFHSDPAAFFHHYIGPELEVFDKETHIHMSLLTQYGSFVSITRSPQVPHYVRLGIHTEKAVNRSNDIELVDTFCKAISDKNRLVILRLLAGRPWYGQELARQLELSPAAISYHMGFFYSVNLISLKRVDQKGYYVLDKDRLECLFYLFEETLHLK